MWLIYMYLLMPNTYWLKGKYWVAQKSGIIDIFSYKKCAITKNSILFQTQDDKNVVLYYFIMEVGSLSESAQSTS